MTAKNVRWGYIDYSVDEYISEEDYIARQTRGVSHKGDILFTTEAPLGNVAIADLDQFSAGQRLITFQQYTNKPELINELMMFFFLSDTFQKQLLENSTGTTVKGIKAERLKRLLIPIPPADEQKRILRTIRFLISKTKDL